MTEEAIAEQLYKNIIKERNEKEDAENEKTLREAAQYQYEKRQQALEKMSNEILVECIEYYKYWKDSATSAQK